MLANKLALAVSAVYSEPPVSFVHKFTDEDSTALLNAGAPALKAAPVCWQHIFNAVDMVRTDARPIERNTNL